MIGTWNENFLVCGALNEIDSEKFKKYKHRLPARKIQILTSKTKNRPPRERKRLI
jgi:hypothetical protein